MPSRTISPNCIGENIRTAREAKGLSQLALGHLIGWKGEDAGAQVSRYESGDKEPRLSTLIRIATALGVELDVLFNPGKKPRFF